MSKYDIKRIRQRVQADPSPGRDVGQEDGPEFDDPSPFGVGVRRYRKWSRTPETIPEIVAWAVYDALHEYHDRIRFNTDEREGHELLDYEFDGDGFIDPDTLTVDTRDWPELVYRHHETYFCLDYEQDGDLKLFVCRGEFRESKHFVYGLADRDCFEQLAATLARFDVILDLGVLA